MSNSFRGRLVIEAIAKIRCDHGALMVAQAAAGLNFLHISCLPELPGGVSLVSF
ncbi:hypothetical protein [Rhizobium sp. BK196]|jgi:hypothetical protein|uniref:hypothetical protein n=1 Tax=Rhizobium sp. BK196 TaxID=2587073 RepID=UPI001AEDC545|nr:hypothetical protein [Rhizobium sp. BK196]